MTDGDCRAEDACIEGGCNPRCSADEDCPATYHCDDAACVLNACDAGITWCDDTARAVLTCSADGNEVALSRCPGGQGCVAGQGEPHCETWLCEPARWTCQSDADIAQLCSLDGQKFERQVNCAESDQRCATGRCFDQVCDPGARHCEGDTVVTCDELGSLEDAEACGDGERCNPETAACAASMCEPDQAGCIAETVAVCRPDGSGFEASATDCAEKGLACWEGECLPILCSAGRSCGEGGSYDCADNRTRLELAEACSFSEDRFCNEETGTCQDFVCAAGQPTCNGDLATRCADDGSHALDFGVDCTVTGKVCWAASCLDPVCEPGTYQCTEQRLEECVHKGTAFELVKPCGEGTVCDAAAGSCRLQKCVPNSPSCNGELATTCDEAGLGYLGDMTDCTKAGKVCSAGSCVPMICDAGQVYCAGNELCRCSDNGGAFEVLSACGASEYCVAGAKTCAADVCQSGVPLCVGDVLTKCESDGSGPAPGGVDCRTLNQVCDRAACRPVVCVAHARFCQIGNVSICNAAGTAWAPYDTCSQREFCAGLEGDARCQADICLEDKLACQGEHIGTCNADGSGFTSVAEDCATNGDVCTLGGACNAVAVDSFGTGGTAVWVNSAIHFEVVHVLTERRLGRIDATLQGIDPALVAWAIYRSASEHGAYALIEQVTGSTPSSEGYLSSGMIDITLERDAYYIVGVVVGGAHQAKVQDGGAPAVLSFGQVLGGFTHQPGGTPKAPMEVVVADGLLRDSLSIRLLTRLSH